MQQQYQYSAVPQQQKQRIMKYPSRQGGRTQPLVANSTRPLMRTNNKQSFNNSNNQQQTPVTNFRQQQQQPPPVKQAGQMRNGGTKKNNDGKKIFINIQ